MTARDSPSPTASDAAVDAEADADPTAVQLVPARGRGPGSFELVDAIEEVRLPVATGDPGVDSGPTATRLATTDRFRAPVDGCWAVEATSVTPLCTADVYVRDDENTLVATATAEAPARIPPGPHVLELSTAPVKTYVAVDGPARVSYEDRYPRVSLDVPERDVGSAVGAVATDAVAADRGRHDGTGRILLGARSRRTSPAGTVTVPESPTGLARAISTFGSALATTSPERSFPTLRGHPPLIERGETFETPRFVERADTGVTLGLPFEYDALFSATPLAFYLAATVEESADPYLRAGEYRHDLPRDPDALAAELGELLRHCFTLDCATRACAVGLYDVNLHVHDVLTERLDPPWTEWYEADLAGRTAAYLEVPTEATLDCLEWPHTTDVVPAAENDSALPFLAADLSVVRSPPPRTAPTSDGGVTELDDFVRASREAVRGATLTRSAGSEPPATRTRQTYRGPTQNLLDDSESIVTPEPADSIAQAWIGPGFPMRAAKPTVETYRRRLDRTPAEDLTISVTVVCNDEAMIDELGDTYGFRDHVTFDIREERDLDCDELRDLLAEEHDFFHYVGHVDERGMECSDGFLDLRSLETTGVDAFLLNACTSYQQGMGLVEAGALGGVVSLTDLPNSLATRVGRDLARLFDAGFPLYAALDVVGTGPFAESAYSIAGDPMVQLCQCSTGVGFLLEIINIDLSDESVSLIPRWYPTGRHKLGGMARPTMLGLSCQWIASGSGSEITTSVDSLLDCLASDRFPIQIEKELLWNWDITREDLLSTDLT
ncbi:hypothetical protein GRX01_13550 [Halobaculum sp. WSA2]|uniref:CHAT domain-containing protein n=1 Tax=Halobaculum saliterrae TaxID=2073113 RepID=A0A6B0T779_9EURY|nr:hypothetical protein [Halobaculum saliterrae]MXR42359.1 hypothetical protein [Halobaculum saliterrae]